MKNRAMEITLGVVAIVAAIAAQWLIAALFVLGAVALYEYHRSKVINPAAPLVCVLGNHVIGNEPFSFFSEDAKEHFATKPYCLRCKDRHDSEIDELIADTDAFLKEHTEKMAATQREWESLPLAERQSRLEANLSQWATKGEDGIWRRRDSGEVVELNARDGAQVRRIYRNPET